MRLVKLRSNSGRIRPLPLFYLINHHYGILIFPVCSKTRSRISLPALNFTVARAGIGTSLSNDEQVVLGHHSWLLHYPMIFAVVFNTDAILIECLP